MSVGEPATSLLQCLTFEAKSFTRVAQSTQTDIVQAAIVWGPKVLENLSATLL